MWLGNKKYLGICYLAGIIVSLILILSLASAIIRGDYLDAYVCTKKAEKNFFFNTAKTQKGLSAALHCNLTMLETISLVQKQIRE